MINIKDFVRKPGKARRYVNVKTGEEISRWKFDTAKAQGITPKEKAKIRKAQGVFNKSSKATTRYSQLVRQYKEKNAAALGVKPSDIKVRGNSPSAANFREMAKKLKAVTSGKNIDRSPNGAYAKVLVELGLRNPEWEFPVGESPTTK